MNTFESTFTCQKCKKSYIGLVMEDELAMTSDMYLPLELVCQHCGYDNLNNKYTKSNNSNTKDNLTPEKEQQAELVEKQQAQKQANLARLITQCSTPPPSTDLAAIKRILESLNNLQSKLLSI